MIPVLRDGYVNFWNSIYRLTNGYSKSASSSDVDVWSVSNEKLKVESKSPFWMTGLPNRRRGSAGDVDVAITFEQEVSVMQPPRSNKYFEAVRSYVRILYLENYEMVTRKIRDDSNYKSSVLSGFHFDLVDQENGSAGYDHPIYHANFDTKCIDLNSLGREGYKLPSELSRIDYPRIPTAPIDLAGATFLILRDHLPDLVERGWPNGIQRNVSKLPRYPEGVLRNLGYRDWYNTDGRSRT